ncbi:MAG: phosphoribosylglycinamide formyltransferase [Gammaproteobacteria bacterium]|nr:phosphoribosylglycinamide formyltransferase [Gammaproteobacteria bacterium]
MKGREPLKVVVLISGQGTNLQALIDTAASPDAGFEVVAVFSDRADARGLERARDAGIAAHHLDRRAFTDRAAFDAALADAIAQYAPGLVVLAGFMRILSPAFVNRFDGRLLNIHPSLLPKFKGLHTHRRVLAEGETEHGATVHLVTAELDDGPPIMQFRIRIRPDDTEDTLAARVHEGEYLIYPRTVAWFAEGRVKIDAGRVLLDGKALNEPVCVEGSH